MEWPRSATIHASYTIDCTFKSDLLPDSLEGIVFFMHEIVALDTEWDKVCQLLVSESFVCPMMKNKVLTATYPTRLWKVAFSIANVHVLPMIAL